MPPLVSIIILNYNARRFANRLAASLARQTYRQLEIIVFDNNSTDRSADQYESLRNQFPSFRVIRNSRNIGFARANNLAVEQASGQYLFFLNCDLWLAPDAIEKIVKHAGQVGRRAIFAPQQLTYDGRKKLNCGLGLDIFGFPVPLRDGVPVFFADGAALFIDRSLFLELGMFDEITFFTGEDVGLSWRARLYGYDIHLVPEAVVYHWSGGILQGGAAQSQKYQTSTQRRFFTERNILRNLLIHYQSRTLLWLWPAYSFWQVGEFFVSWIMLGGSAALVYPRSWKWNWTNRMNIKEWRRVIKSRRHVDDRTLMRRMVWQQSKIQRLKQVGVPEVKS